MNKEDKTPPGVSLRDFEDYTALRENVFDAALTGMQDKFPQEYGKYRVELADTHYAEDKDYDLAKQKDSLMKNQYLTKRLRGTMKLYDKETGDLMEEKKLTLMRVPYVTDRGTAIHNGNEYVTLNQARLSSGIYTRKKESGEIEAHINAKRGTGKSYRLRLEPETSLYKLDIDQASLRLYSLLHDIGVSDDELELRWGPDILAANRAKYDSRVLDKAYDKLVRFKEPGISKEDKIQAVKDALSKTKISRSSVERTLPNLFNAKKASEWRKAGFQQNPAMQNMQTAQNSEEFVKWDQKRQEMEAKAQEKQEKADLKRDLDERRKKLEIQGLNADILNEHGKVDQHAVVKQVMQNLHNRQKTQKNIATKKVTKKLKHDSKQELDKVKSEDKLQDRYYDIKDKEEQKRIEAEREQVMEQVRSVLPQKQPELPMAPVQPEMPEQPGMEQPQPEVQPGMPPIEPEVPTMQPDIASAQPEIGSAKFARIRPGSPLDEMIKAKKDSDVRKYNDKHSRMRNLIMQHPQDFQIDSKEGNIYGVSHAPTGFRMHLPKHVVADLDINDQAPETTGVADKARNLIGLDKAAASIAGAEINLTAPNYRQADDDMRTCATCKHRSETGHCNAYNFNCVMKFTCDTWEEDTVKLAAKGTYRQSPEASPKPIHTKTLHNGHEVDVLKLKELVKDRTAESLSLDDLSLAGANRSKRSGFGPKRYEDADTNDPILIDNDNNIVDGRHRYFKSVDNGLDKISVLRVSDDDIAAAYTSNDHPDYEGKKKV